MRPTEAIWGSGSKLTQIATRTGRKRPVARNDGNSEVRVTS